MMTEMHNVAPQDHPDFRAPLLPSPGWEAHEAPRPFLAPEPLLIEIAGRRYSGTPSRRAIRAAMTRAGATEVRLNGYPYNAAGLAYRLDLTA